ncbi:MAG: hypothetical protein GY847_29410 [Proteobacteria bacterium]|nr:hypothetical protein [Pseudomonadota bacterium]
MKKNIMSIIILKMARNIQLLVICSFLQVTVMSALVPVAAEAESTQEDMSDTPDVSSMPDANPTAARRLHISLKLGITPRILDIDMVEFYFGAHSLELNSQYFLLDDLGLGIRAKYEKLAMFEYEHLSVHFIDLQALAGYFATTGLQVYLALGTTIVGNVALSKARHDAQFSLASGSSYTFWLGIKHHAGIILGNEFNMMFNKGFKHTNTTSGVIFQNVFIYIRFFIGIRYSLLL